MTAAPRVRIAAAVALTLALAGLAVVLLASGSGEADAGRLSWKGKVQVFTTGLPTDRVLYTELENTSLRDIDLDMQKVKVFAPDGKPVRSSVIFLAAFAHGIFPYNTGELSDFEKRRLGKIATVKPGQAIPVTLSWRVPKGSPQPTKVDFGPAELPIPQRVSAG
jgi:hypothetical protein